MISIGMSGLIIKQLLMFSVVLIIKVYQLILIIIKILQLTFLSKCTDMKKIIFFLLVITATFLSGCVLEEEVVNIRVHGYIRDKITNDPIASCNVYILNEYISESNEYIGQTDSNGYYEFNRDVWNNYSTDISVYLPTYKTQYIEINNDPDTEVNFFLEKY